MITADYIKEHVRRKVSEFRSCEDGEFACRGRVDDECSLAASCDVALCLYAIDEFKGEPEPAWADYINSFQDERTGWFRDEASIWVDLYRIDPWLFGFALRSLNALQAQPAFAPRFLSVWDTLEKMRDWIFAGKGVMHLAIIWFTWGQEFHPFDNFEDSFFDILAQHRERFVPDRSAFHQALQHYDPTAAQSILKDAFHTLFAWYASGRKIPQKQLYLDWFLNEQDENGLFFQQDTCAPIYSHMDGLQLVVELSQYTDYRQQDCEQAVQRGLEAILDEKNFDQFWNVDCIHNLLASCETVAQAIRLLPNHPVAQSRWNCVWDLQMWYLDDTHFKEYS